jgi:predicted Zn-dependent peptidase
LNTVEEPKDRLKKFEAVTLEDVARVAKQYLRFDRMSLAAIGPFTSEDELRALLPVGG